MCQKNFLVLKLDIFRNTRWTLELICHFSTEHVVYDIDPYRVRTMNNCRDSLTNINSGSPVRTKRFRRTVWDSFQNSVQFYSVEVSKETFRAKINILCSTRWNAGDSRIRYFCCTSNKPIQFAIALLLSYTQHLLFKIKYIFLFAFQSEWFGVFFFIRRCSICMTSSGFCVLSG